jgi:hypothetical protein
MIPLDSPANKRSANSEPVTKASRRRGYLQILLVAASSIVHPLRIIISVGRRKFSQMDSHSESRSTSQVLLLPDEYCLAEDKDTVLKLHYEREGYKIFGRGITISLQTTAYLTNYRVPSLMSTNYYG